MFDRAKKRKGAARGGKTAGKGTKPRAEGAPEEERRGAARSDGGKGGKGGKGPSRDPKARARAATRAVAGLTMGSIDWYRGMCVKMGSAVTVLGIAVLVLLVIDVVAITTRPSPVYFAATPGLKLAKLKPLNRPTMTQSGLINWATGVVTNTLGLDFLHWRNTLMKVKPDYTSSAFKSLVGSMQKSGMLDKIRKQRLVVSATVSKAPVIVAHGVVHGVLLWKIKIPLVVSYESSQGVQSTQHLIAMVLVERIKTSTYPRGVRIRQIVINQAS